MPTVSTGTIRAVHDSATEPDGMLLPSANTIEFIMQWLRSHSCYRLVWWRERFYAVEVEK